MHGSGGGALSRFARAGAHDRLLALGEGLKAAKVHAIPTAI
jgi:hypothetical protein